MVETFAFYSGLTNIFIQYSGNIWTKPSDFQIEKYLATSWDSSITTCLSSYTFTPLFNFIFMDKLVGVGMQKYLCLKKSSMLDKKTPA